MPKILRNVKCSGKKIRKPSVALTLFLLNKKFFQDILHENIQSEMQIVEIYIYSKLNFELKI